MLLATLPMLASRMGLEGAAIAFLASATISATVAVALLKPPIRPLLAAWGIHFIVAALAWAGFLGGVGVLAAAALSLVAIHFTGLMSLGEALEVARIVASTLINVRVKRR